MLGRTNASAPVPGPPDPQVIEEFNVNKIGGPSKRIGLLRLDLEGPVRSPWNVEASRCFRNSFNESQLYHQWPDEFIEEAFLRHIETIRVHYNQQTGRISADAAMERQVRSARRSRVKTVCACHLAPSASRLSNFTAHSQQAFHLRHDTRCFPIQDLRKSTGRRGWHERR